MIVYDNVALVNSSVRVSFNVTLLPSGRVYVDYRRFVDACRLGYTIATNRVAGASASAATNLLLEGALGMGAITTVNSDIGSQESAFLPSAAGAFGSLQRPFLIGLRAPSPGIDPKVARFPLHTRSSSSAPRPALDLAALTLINGGTSSVPPTAAMADASVVAAVAWQATASFPSPASDAWNWSAAARGVYPPLEALRGIANLGTRSE